MQGSTFLYLSYIHPFLLQHEDGIDAAIVDARQRARQLGLEYGRRVWTLCREAVRTFVASVRASFSFLYTIPPGY